MTTKSAPLKERMANLIMTAEAPNRTFLARQEAINKAEDLKIASKKSFAYFGLTDESFAKLTATLDRQQSEMDADNITDPDMTYASYRLSKDYKETIIARAGNHEDRIRKRRWWQFWRR